MKKVMSSCPVLALLDFTQPFVLECDAYGEGIRVVLMQNRNPIYFESRKLQPYERNYSIYDKEMMSIMHALDKFRQYLVGRKFVLKTDHNSLINFLTQKELNGMQQNWVCKFQAYEFDIEYKKGKMNVVVDALSIKPTFYAMEDPKGWKEQLS